MDLTQLSNIDVLALTIYGEARGEPIEGQIAVGCVIRNRLNSSRTKHYYDVCLEPKQFSCWNKDDPNFPVLSEMSDMILIGQNIVNLDYQQCLWVANGIVNRLIKDTVDAAKYYFTNSLFHSPNKPHWSMSPINIKQIANQTFFSI